MRSDGLFPKLERMKLREKTGSASAPSAETIVLVLILSLIASLRFFGYLLFHTFAELFSVVIASAYAVIAWHSRKIAVESSIGALGIAYVFVAVLDTVHTLAYAGMGVFVGYDFPANQVWVVARFLEALALCCFPYLDMRRTAHARAAFAAYLSVTVAGLASIFVFRNFPACFVAGAGQTPFKIGAEIVIILILIAAAAVLRSRRGAYSSPVYRLLLLSIIFTILSELSFMVYLSNYDYLNLLGHILKIVSFYLVYRAVVVTCLERPQEILFTELRNTSEELRRSNEAKDHFISILSHDLRGPLAGILSLASSYTEQEGRAPDGSEIVALAEIGKAADSSLRLMERVLAWAKARGGNFAPKLESVDTAVAIGYEIQAVEGRAARKGVRLIVELAREPRVVTDADMLSLIVRNILQNAVKFTSAGTVTVSTGLRGGSFYFEVADTGIGMDEDILGRLFDPTSRVTTAGTDGEKGSGFGLVLCAEIAARLGGTLAANSRSGAGSVFTLSLPVGRSDE